MTNGEKAAKLWADTLSKTFPFHAEAPCSVSPERLPKREFGHHASVILTKGTRTFGFESERARDRFVAEHRRAGAVAVD